MSGISVFASPYLAHLNEARLKGTITDMQHPCARDCQDYDIGQNFLPTDFICSAQLKIKTLNEQPCDPFMVRVDWPHSLFSRVSDQLEFTENTAIFRKTLQFSSTVEGKNIAFDLKLPKKRVYTLSQDSTCENAISFVTGMRILKKTAHSTDDSPTFLKKAHSANLKAAHTEQDFGHFLTRALSTSACADIFSFGIQEASSPQKTTYYAEGKVETNDQDTYRAEILTEGKNFLIYYDRDYIYIQSIPRYPDPPMTLGSQFTKIARPLSGREISQESTISTGYALGGVSIEFFMKFLPENSIPEPITTIAVHAKEGLMGLRGKGGPLESWDQTLKMGPLDSDLHVWQTEQMLESADFKVVRNQEEWENFPHNRTIKKGDRIELTPEFSSL